MAETYSDSGTMVQEQGDLAPAADKLRDAASFIHENAERRPGGERVSELAHGAASRMEAAADYVGDRKFADLWDDLESCIRAHPAKSLLGAVAVGFLVGRAFRSRG